MKLENALKRLDRSRLLRGLLLLFLFALMLLCNSKTGMVTAITNSSSSARRFTVSVVL